MQTIDAVVESRVSRSMRARQLEALFDVPSNPDGATETLEWRGEIPIDEREWNVGLIVGPSGSGKTTVARSLFGEVVPSFDWNGASVIDDFPANVSLEQIAAICQAVGFNTIPAWLRPFHVLSNGEQFRVALARLLAEKRPIAVLDEFTSVVDRQVAKIGSHAVQKHVRRTGGRFVAVSCHDDIIEWLQPDWILELPTLDFQWRELQRRPHINAYVGRVAYDAWRIFAPYHYMSSELNRCAQCFCLFVDNKPASFVGLLHRPISAKGKHVSIWGVSRVVTLPDYQGMGLAFVLMDKIASALRAAGARCRMYPAHPSFMRSFDKSSDWSMVQQPGYAGLRNVSTGSGKVMKGGFGGRPCAVFEYIGPAMQGVDDAKRFLGIKALS